MTELRGVIVKNAYYNSFSYSHQISRIYEEFSNAGVSVQVYENKSAVAIGDTFNIDFAVFLDKDVNLASAMENRGVRVFNRSKAIACTDDKILTALMLDKSNIKFPKTIPAPLQYRYECDEVFLLDVSKRLGFPLVVKKAVGSLGIGVYLARDFDGLVSIDREIGNSAKLYQQFVAPEGKSIRALVIGGEIIAAMQLNNAKDFRSNANVGGIAERITLGNEYSEAVRELSKIFGLDYCGIDFFACQDSPAVIEINSNAFFHDLESVSEVSIAKAYAEYIIGELMCAERRKVNGII